MKKLLPILLVLSFEALAVPINDQSFSSVKDIIGYKGTDIKPNNKEGEHGEIVRNSAARAKEFEFSKNEFSLAKDAKANPHKYVDWLSGEGAECKAGEGSITTTDEHICNEFNEVSEKSCTAVQKVEVAPKYKYECLKSINKLKKRCFKTLYVDVEEQSDCFNGQIKHISGGNVSINYPIITIRPTFGALNKTPPNHGYSSSVDVEVLNLLEIQEAILTVRQFNVISSVYINDELIHVRESPGQFYYNKYGSLGVFEKGGATIINAVNWFISNKVFTYNVLSKLKKGKNNITFHSYVNTNPTILELKIKSQCQVEKEIWVEKCEEVK